MTIRVRFAPSPTGEPHVGNIRTTIFNWLFARKNGGQFIVRIEDTDRIRYKPESIKAIRKNLEWLGLNWDEGLEKGGAFGPYTQSERLHIYKEYAEKLIHKGWAYRCNCSAERLEKLREYQRENKLPLGYDGYCRKKSDGEVLQSEPHIIRLKVPNDGKTEFNDLVWGLVSFENSQIDDQVLIKSDAFPTYHMAVVIDDHLMKITHVIRGDDWISSTPKHLILYDAFGWIPPVYAHVPRVLGEDGKKLSKRHGATSIEVFKEKGYLPEAIFNFLSLLGWQSEIRSDREIFSVEEMIHLFQLEDVSKSPAIFSYDKLDWLNGIYIRKLSISDFTQRLREYYDENQLFYVAERLEKISTAVQNRIKVLGDTISLLEFLFIPAFEPAVSGLTIESKSNEQIQALLGQTLAQLADITPWTSENIETALRELQKRLGEKPRDYFGLLRNCLTNQKVSPPLFSSIFALGSDETLKRLKVAINLL